MTARTPKELAETWVIELQTRLHVAEAERDKLREALAWIEAEPEDPLKVQARALAALAASTKDEA